MRFQRWLFASVVCAGLAAWGGAAASAECMNSERDATAEGRLVTGRFKDAADRPETAYILQLATPVCLDGPVEEDKVANTKRIHVAPEDETLAPRFKRLVGKRVVVQGRPFGAHTAHHHAPIVMLVTKIEPR